MCEDSRTAYLDARKAWRARVADLREIARRIELVLKHLQQPQPDKAPFAPRAAAAPRPPQRIPGDPGFWPTSDEIDAAVLAVMATRATMLAAYANVPEQDRDGLDKPPGG